MLPEKFEPNFAMIDASDIWNDQIVPWLEGRYFDALEGRLAIGSMPRLPTGDSPTLEDFHFWRGAATAIKMIAGEPSMMAAEKRLSDAQRKTDGILEQEQSRTADYRRSTA